MNTTILEQNIYYTETGESGTPVLCLHGWGCDSGFFEPIANALADSHKVYTVDFPAHGRSEKPKQIWEYMILPT